MHTAQMDKAQTNEAFAAATGRPASTFSKIGASLQPTRWGMPGGQGGGGNTRHANAPYLTGVVLGSGAYQPKDGHEVVEAAAGCDYLGSAIFLEAKGPGPGGIIRSTPQKVDVPELQAGSTLLEYVQSRIEFYAGEPVDAPQTLISKPLDVDGSLIRLDFDPFAAQVEWRSEPTEKGNYLLVHYFVPKQELAKRQHMNPKAAAREMAHIRRSSILPASMIFVAAQILADGWAKTGKGLPGSGQGEASTTVSPENERPANEKTPSLPQPGASRNFNQSREPRETRTLTRPDSKRVCAKSQAHASSRGRLTTEPRRHDARSEDPPSFGLFAAGLP